jgi:hypothetical protein
VLRVIPRRGSRLAFPSSPEQLFLLLDDQQRVIENGAPPVPEIASSNPNARVPFVAATSDGALWTMIFATASPLLVYEGTDLRCRGNLIEGNPEFPSTIGRDTPIRAVAVAMSDSQVFVLARGQTDLERQLLDVYSADTCEYVGSYRLPRKLQAMAYDAGVFHFYYEEPTPAILALRMTTSEAES